MGQAVRLHSFADVDRSGKVRWTACELGLDVEEARLEVGQHMSEEYRALNPYAQIPTLEAGGEALIESTAICLVLAERHPEAGLVPDDPAQRECFWQQVSVATTTLETPVVNYFLSKVGFMDEHWQRLLKEFLELRLTTFAQGAPEEGYLCGEFSLADIFAAYVLRIGVQAGLLENSGPLADYLNRLRDRPAAQAARFFDSLDA